MEAKPWVKFTTETGLKCAYLLGENFSSDAFDYRAKVLTGVPRGFYASASNEAGLYFEQKISPTLRGNDYQAGK